MDESSKNSRNMRKEDGSNIAICFNEEGTICAHSRNVDIPREKIHTLLSETDEPPIIIETENVKQLPIIICDEENKKCLFIEMLEITPRT